LPHSRNIERRASPRLAYSVMLVTPYGVRYCDANSVQHTE
jgi:hypothetical protein